MKRILRAALFAVVGLIGGAAVAGAVVLTCSAVRRQPGLANGSTDWVAVLGLAALALGPLAGLVAGLVVALRTAR